MASDKDGIEHTEGLAHRSVLQAVAAMLGAFRDELGCAAK
jgi:hypothetical protein